MKTKDKILASSLEEFTAQGVAQVSTNHLADSLDISPGSLYHHFKNKQVIVRELYRWFVGDFVTFLRADEQQVSGSRELWLVLNLSLQLVHRYRFVFRDANYIIQKYPELEPDFREVVQKTDRASRNFCYRLAENGVIEAREFELESLATNLHLIFTQWMGYGELRAACFKPTGAGDGNEALAADPQSLRLGFYQVLRLFAPYISDRDKEDFDRMVEAYT